MVPKLLAITHLVQFGDAHTVFVGGYVLGNDVHGHLAEVEVGSDAGGGGDARLAQHMRNHAPSQFVGAYLVCSQIVGDIHEHLVDGVDMDVLGGYVLEVDAIDACAVVDVVGHARRSHQVAQGLLRMCSQLDAVGGLALQLPSRGVAASLGIDLPHALHHLEQACTAADTVGLE